jgi:hypothetical protein
LVSTSSEGNVERFYFKRPIEWRVCEVYHSHNLSLEQRWNPLKHLQRVFKRFNNEKYIYDIQKSADTLTQTLKDLGKLQSPNEM